MQNQFASFGNRLLPGQASHTAENWAGASWNTACSQVYGQPDTGDPGVLRISDKIAAAGRFLLTRPPARWIIAASGYHAGEAGQWTSTRLRPEIPAPMLESPAIVAVLLRHWLIVEPLREGFPCPPPPALPYLPGWVDPASKASAACWTPVPRHFRLPVRICAIRERGRDR